MQMRKFILATISALTLCNLYAENPNQAMVERMIKTESDIFFKEDPLNPQNKLDKSFNWGKIFKEIDKYKLDPTKLNGRSLLKIAINVNSVERAEHRTKRAQDAFNAIKTLLEKYHWFKTKPCGIDNCDELIAQALESDSWDISEGSPNLAIVDLLLKYGAKPNQQTIKNIRKAYDKGGHLHKEGLPHVKSLLKR